MPPVDHFIIFSRDFREKNQNFTSQHSKLFGLIPGPLSELPLPPQPPPTPPLGTGPFALPANTHSALRISLLAPASLRIRSPLLPSLFLSTRLVPPRPRQSAPRGSQVILVPLGCWLRQHSPCWVRTFSLAKSPTHSATKLFKQGLSVPSVCSWARARHAGAVCLPPALPEGIRAFPHHTLSCLNQIPSTFNYQRKE